MNRFCASEKVNFVARANLANRYDWSFGNGNTINTYDTITTHQFRNLGLKNIVVTPRYNECASVPMRIVVRVEGAVSRFIYNNTCEEKKTFQFTNNSLGNVNQAIWNIDDLNRTLTQNNISITFPNNGAYWISLAVQDSATGCKDTSKVKILTATPELFTAADTLCVNTHAAFQVKNTYANNATTYSWQTLNLSPQISSDSIFSPFADSLGIYPYNTVIISNGRGYCNDTLSLNHPVLIKGPKANFHTQTEICQAQSLSFDNRTVHYPNQSESMMYSWDLGDNSPSIQSFTPIPHQFATDGQYTIKMTATDTYGCKDSVENIVQVRPMPFLWILPRSKTICQGQNLSLTGYTSDQISWYTSLPSNPFCSTCDSNLITPPHTTTYKAVSTNQYLCAATDSITITVMEPFTASIQPPQASICEKETISLALSPSGKMVSWTPDPTLNTSNPYLPVAQPTSSKRFEVVLSDSLNCFSSTAGIHVQVNPLPTVELGENKMLSWGTLYNLNPAYSSNVRSFLWTPADKLNCSTCPNPQITVKSLEQIGVKVTSDSGCVNTDKISLAVECNNAYLLMPGAFTPDGDGLNDIYYPITRGMKYIKRFSIYNRSSQLMFQRQDCFPNDRQAGWNGKFKGESQPPGTYVYVIEAVCEFGLSTIKSGSFVLIR
jgi:gliding motility-associated-like protein